MVSFDGDTLVAFRLYVCVIESGECLSLKEEEFFEATRENYYKRDKFHFDFFERENYYERKNSLKLSTGR